MSQVTAKQAATGVACSAKAMMLYAYDELLSYEPIHSGPVERLVMYPSSRYRKRKHTGLVLRRRRYEVDKTSEPSIPRSLYSLNGNTLITGRPSSANEKFRIERDRSRPQLRLSQPITSLPPRAHSSVPPLAQGWTIEVIVIVLDFRIRHGSTDCTSLYQTTLEDVQ